MQIYLLRHAIAEDGGPVTPDRDRILTPEGRKRLRDVLRAARAAGVAPDVLLASPYKRGLETASITAEVLGFQGSITSTNSLVPGGSPEVVWEEIRVYRGEEQVLLASHEPLMSATLAYLLGCPQLLVEFKKATLARVDVDRFGPTPRGVLRWLLTPKLAGNS
ncbi:MAG: histidine phosphatase family protein [Acidobacteria bacterium]|nr:histidine phosphatase family protein [Acidobacteriota bacterium]